MRTARSHRKAIGQGALRHLPILGTFMLLCLLSHPVHAVPLVPTWQADLEARPDWRLEMDGGICLWGAKDQVHALDVQTGEELWRFSDGQSLESGDVDPVPGTVVLLVFRPAREKGGAAHVQARNARTGESLWDREFADFQAVLSGFPIYDHGMVILGGVPTSAKNAVQLVAIGLQGGGELWRGPVYESRLAPATFSVGHGKTLQGGCPPIRDTDSTAVLLLTDKWMSKVNLRSGKVMWEITDPMKGKSDRTGSAPALGFAPPARSEDGTTFYIPGGERVFAFRFADGAALWDDPPKLLGQPVQLLPCKEGIAALLFGSTQKKPFHAIALLDPTSGQVRWSQPHSRPFLPSESHVSNPIIRGSDLCLAKNGKLRRFALSSGEEREVADLDWQGDDHERWLESREDGVLVGGDQTLIHLDEQDHISWTAHRDPPGGSAFGLVLAAGSLFANRTTIGSSGGTQVSFGIDPSAGLEEWAREFSATTPSSDAVFVLSGKTTDNRDGPALIRLRKSDGQPDGEIVVDSKTPDYDVIQGGAVVIVVKDRTHLLGYRFEH